MLYKVHFSQQGNIPRGLNGNFSFALLLLTQKTCFRVLLLKGAGLQGRERRKEPPAAQYKQGGCEKSEGASRTGFGLATRPKRIHTGVPPESGTSMQVADPLLLDRVPLPLEVPLIDHNKSILIDLQYK